MTLNGHYNLFVKIDVECVTGISLNRKDWELLSNLYAPKCIVYHLLLTIPS